MERKLVEDHHAVPAHTFISSYLMKMKGERVKAAHIKVMDYMISAIGGLITIIIISLVEVSAGYTMVIGPIGATCLLVFAIHEGPFSQPRQVIGGHFISTLIALLIWSIFGKDHFTIGLTLAIVVFLMFILRIVHPPAAASALVAINTEAGWAFLFMIVLCSIMVVVCSLLYNNLFKSRQYPKYWF